jgi:thiol-disulfide isomerase/thioredoxin
MAEVVHPFGIGQLAPEFHGLLGVDGQRYSLSSFNEMTVLVIAFTGNGCPTVKAEEDKMKALQGSYGPRGVQFVAINSNNPYLSPPDTFAEMEKRARETIQLSVPQRRRWKGSSSIWRDQHAAFRGAGRGPNTPLQGPHG